MTIAWGTLAVGFGAAAVEWVEAFTVVLAVSVTTGWRRATWATAAALAVIALLIALTHRALASAGQLPWLRFGVGVFLLLFGLRWLTKAMARTAGLRPLHDEAAVFDATHARAAGVAQRAASAMAFQAVLLEGLEVWLIVAALGTAPGGLLSAGLGALLALVLVAALGVALRAPLTRVPENALKYLVACALLTFGTFWTAEAWSLSAWPLGDVSPVFLFATYFLGGRFVATCLRSSRRHPAETAT